MSKYLYLQFFILGFGAWIHHLAIVAQANYWKHFYGGNALTYISNSFLIAELVGSLVTLKISKYFQTRTFMYSYFVYTSFSMLLTVCILKINNIQLRLVCTVINAVISGAIAASYFSNLVSASSRIGRLFTQAVQFGGGLSFFANQLVQDFITMSFKVIQDSPQYSSNLKKTAIVYYSSCSLVLLICSVVWWQLEQNQNQVNYDPKLNKITRVQKFQLDSQQTSLHPNDSKVFKQIWVYSVCLFLNHAITYTLHPLFIVNIPCKQLVIQHKRIYNDNFILIFLTVHQLANFLGRLSPAFSIVQKLITTKIMTILTILRVIFIALLILQNFPLTSITIQAGKHVFQFPVITNIVVAYVTNVLFIFSATFVQTIALMQFQQQLKTVEEKARGSFIVNLFMQGGITTGGMLGIVLGKLAFDN